MKKSLFAGCLAAALSLAAADFEIVIPEKPFPVEKFAASELKTGIEKTTGKSGVIVNRKSEDAPLRFLLGRSSGLDTSSLKGNCFILRTQGNEVRIAGPDGPQKIDSQKLILYGTLYGVYEYLGRQYGVRYLWPGENGTYFPKGRKLEAGTYDLTWTPPLAHAVFRKFPLDWNHKVMRGQGPQPRAAGKQSGHAFGWWRDEFFAAHPDWFAARDAEGKNRYRTYSAMCVSNPEFHDKIIELWRETPALAVNCRENDGYGNCACSRCRSWDGEDKRWPSSYYQSAHNAGERYGKFYRTVFDKARAINPHATLNAYAYMNFVYAPRRTKLHPDIIIGFVDDLPFPRSRHHQDLVNEEIDAWLESGASLVWRPNFTWAGYALPFNYARQCAEEFKRMYRSGRLRGVDFDGPNLSWATLGFNYYTIARLTDDPGLDMNAIEKEYASAFRAGAEDVLEYLHYWEKYTMDNAEKINDVYEKESERRCFFYGFYDASVAHRLISLDAYAPAEAILLRAAAKTANDPEASARIAFLLAGLRHSKLCVESCAVFADPQKNSEARLQMLERVRNFRKTLPQGAADIPYFTRKGRLEDHAWKFSAIDINSSLPLPEMWSADLVINREELREETGDRQLSTWQFVDDQIFGGTWNYCRYRCTVSVPEKWRNSRVILHLGAVDESCEVKVNGGLVGKFTYDAVNNPGSWEQPQKFDVSKEIRFGEDNSFEVLVYNETRKGGLWRPSFLIFKPAFAGPVKSWNFENDAQGWRLGSFEHVPGRLQIKAAPGLAPAKTGLRYDFAPGGHRFEIGARVKTDKFPSRLSLAVREVDAQGKTIGYHTLELNPNPERTDKSFRKESSVVQVRREAAEIQLYIIPDPKIESDSGSAEITDIYIGPLAD